MCRVVTSDTQWSCVRWCPPLTWTRPEQTARRHAFTVVQCLYSYTHHSFYWDTLSPFNYINWLLIKNVINIEIVPPRKELKIHDFQFISPQNFNILTHTTGDAKFWKIFAKNAQMLNGQIIHNLVKLLPACPWLPVTIPHNPNIQHHHNKKLLQNPKAIKVLR